MLVVEKRDAHHNGNGQRFQTLIGPNCVVLQRDICEDNEAAKGDGHGQHLTDGYLDMLKDLGAMAQDEANESDDKVNACQSHVGKGVLDVDVLVDLDDEDGREDIDRQTDRHDQLVEFGIEPSHDLHN